ncbi:MAG: hypothetical protein AAFW46_07930 [Pseudomonadota bacterium]
MSDDPSSSPERVEGRGASAAGPDAPDDPGPRRKARRPADPIEKFRKKLRRLPPSSRLRALGVAEIAERFALIVPSSAEIRAAWSPPQVSRKVSRKRPRTPGSVSD